MGIAEALRTTYEDNEHRTQHWVQLVAIANGSRGTDATVARLEREVQELRSMVHRSRSPRRQPKQKALPAPPRQLALPALPTRRGEAKEGALDEEEVRDEADKRTRRKRPPVEVFAVPASSSSGSGLISFDQMMSMGSRALSLFHSSNKKGGSQICWLFQKGACSDPKRVQEEALLHPEVPRRASRTTSAIVCSPSWSERSGHTQLKISCSRRCRLQVGWNGLRNPVL